LNPTLLRNTHYGGAYTSSSWCGPSRSEPHSTSPTSRPAPSVKHPPSFTRTYPVRPALEVRFVLPKDHQRSAPSTTSPPSPLPLYIHIRGGAFALGTASLDDLFCASWAIRTSTLVASLNYSKSSLSRFPTPTYDIEALVLAILSDTHPTVAIDHSRIIIGGSSAGACLALSASQLPSLRGKIKAAVAYFPLLDWAEFPRDKQERLHTLGEGLDWAYLPAGQYRREKLLSLMYVRKEELPPWVCLIGAEWDMLCREERDMALRLGAGDGDRMCEELLMVLKGRLGNGKVDDGQVRRRKTAIGGMLDKREMEWDVSKGFETEHYKWVLVKGMRHAFTDEIGLTETASSKKKMEASEEVYADVAA
jgi:acetyl esterase/lipase